VSRRWASSEGVIGPDEEEAGMRVAIVGAGAVGGLIGTRLAAAGVPTSALARGETLEALRTKGWRLRSGDELVTAPARASADATELGPQDVVIVSLKTQRSAASRCP
jgi:2-dehydropantoate 2-reductase